MNKQEYKEQSEYCLEQNTPEGLGCDMCPGHKSGYCADRLENTVGKLLKAKNAKEREPVVTELRDKFGMPEGNILALERGYIKLPAALED